MTPDTDFLGYLTAILSRYRAEVADPDERFAVLRWQIAERHRLDSRATLPGHVTTSAFVLSPDLTQILLIDHVALGRWLQPGGHYEPATRFSASAAREAVEETGVQGMVLHPWHQGQDVPFTIETQEIAGRASRGETDHLHHDLQYLFTADPALPLVAQEDEVRAALWQPISALAVISPRAVARLEKVRLR